MPKSLITDVLNLKHQTRVVAALLISCSLTISIAAAQAESPRTSPEMTPVIAAGVQQVEPHFYRGAYPDANLLRALKKAGVTTIVCLCNEKGLVDRESNEASVLGLKFVNIPLSAFHHPTDDEIQHFLSITRTRTQDPIYVHCLHGEDRTGAMVALFRVMEGGWSGEAAYQEMREDGFHPFFVSLARTVFAHARTQGQSNGSRSTVHST